MHKLPFIGMLFCAVLAAGAHAADPYPSRTVTVAVPYSPGGSTDYVARVFAKHMTDAYQKSFIVDNKPGASGTIAMGYVAKAEPNGYTLLVTEMTTTVVPTLFPKLTFDPIRDFDPVAQIAEAAYTNPDP